MLGSGVPLLFIEFVRRSNEPLLEVKPYSVASGVGSFNAIVSFAVTLI